MAEGLFGTNQQAPQLQQTRIQPAGTPGSTFVRPPQVASGGNLRALSDALGSLNSSLNAYGSMKDKIEDDPNSRANKEWVAKRQQMSIEELRAEAEAGTHDGIRVRQDAVEALLGERANVDFRAEAMRRYETEFDIENGDFDSWFEGVRTEYAEGLPGDVAKGNFFRLTDGFKGSMLESNTSTRVTTAKTQINATIVDSWYTQIGDMIGTDGAADANQIAEAIFASSAGNKSFYGLSGEEQNATIWALAQRAAMDGNPDIAKALLFTKRDGVAIGEIPAYVTKAHGLIETGQGIRDEADNKNSLDVRLDVTQKVSVGTFTAEDAKALDGSPYYTPQQLAAMTDASEGNRQRIAKDGATAEQKRLLRLHSDNAKTTVKAQAVAATSEVGGVFKLRDVEIPNATGTGTITLSREAQIEDARLFMEDQWTQQENELVNAGGKDPKEAKAAMNSVRLAWYAGNGVVNESWKNRLNSLPLMANPETFKDRPEAMGKFTEYAEEWRTMKAQNPAYADSLLDSKSREFLDLYDTARTAHDLPEGDAMAYAAGWASRPEADKNRYKIEPKAADKIVKGVLGDIGVDNMEGTSFSIVNQKVQTWAAMGLSAEQIKANTQKWAASSTVQVKGVLMASERPLPADFADVADRYLDSVFTDRGEAEGLESSDDLFLQSVSGESKWQVWSKSRGVPIGNVYLDDKGMQSIREAATAEREDMIRKDFAAPGEFKDKRKAEAQPRLLEYVKKERDRIERLRLPQKSWLNGHNPPNNKAADAAQAELERVLNEAGYGHLIEK